MSMLVPCAHAADIGVKDSASQGVSGKSPFIPKPIYRDNFQFRVTLDTDKDRIVKIIYERKSDGKIISEGYPYGREDYGIHHREELHSRASFKQLMAKRVNKHKSSPRLGGFASSTTNGVAMASATSTPINTTGMGIGYNPSTGYLGGSSLCYNFSTQLSDWMGSESFSSQNAASSYAEQTKVSGDVSGSYGAFNASDSFSYSNAYSSSTNSGQIYFNAAQVAVATNTLNSDSSTGLITQQSALNATGNQAQQAGTFPQQCGSYILSAVPVGMLITGQFSWSSSSSSSSSAISNGLKASYGLNSISTAVSKATSNSTTNNSFSFTTNISGGGEGVSTTWYNCIGNTATQADLTNCEGGSSSACSSMATNYNTCANNTLAQATTDLANSPSDMSPLAVFPYGVAGVQTTPSQGDIDSLYAIFSSSVTDPFDSMMSAALSNYVNILNQINTLNNRLNYLGQALANNSFDPAPQLPVISTYINPLVGAYSGDASAFMATLNGCLQNPGGTDCTTISNLYSEGVTDAFAFYGGAATESSSNTNKATPQNQNALALQYAGTTYYSGGAVMTFPVDVIWAYQLPTSWTSTPPGSNPAGYPAMIAFADAPYPFNGSLRTAAWATMYPHNKGYGITTQGLTWWGDSESLTNYSWYSDTQWSNYPTVSGSDAKCQNKAFSYYADPLCTFSSDMNESSPGFTLQVDLSPIPNFFGSQSTITLN